MKYSVHDYAKALDEAMADPATVKTGKAAIAKNFLELIRHNGDEARLKKILDEAARLSRKRDVAGGASFRDVLIESARPLEKSQEKMLHSFIKPSDVVEYATNPDLIAGVRITVNDEMEFDGTMKAKLDSLFEQLS
jgi:F0F1-type ATP synthase delta subunit